MNHQETVPLELDNDEDDLDLPNLVLFRVEIAKAKAEYRLELGLKMSFTDPQSRDVVLTVLRSKMDETFFKQLPEEARSRIGLSVDSEDDVFWIRATLPADLWDSAPGDSKQAFLASHVKLALAATLRALAISIEAHDLFSLGKSAIGPLHARMSALKEEPKPS